MQLHTKDVDGVRVFTLDNPPINALGFKFSETILEAVSAAENDGSVKGVVFTGANNIFSGGADVNDFSTEPTAETKTIRDVIAAVDRSSKPYAVAIDGNALGGGLELSLASDYRVATKRSKVGLPEIKLGLLPGAGGTQRLPRLIGAQAALEFMLKGNSQPAEKAKELGIIDEIIDDNAVDDAVAFAKKIAEHPTQEQPAKRRISEKKAFIGKGITAQA